MIMTCICWADVGLSTLIALLLVLFTYAVIYSLRPKLKIDKYGFEKGGGAVRIPVRNMGRYNAVNIRIEVCALDPDSSRTYHFKVDHPDFLILTGRCSNDNEKVFKTLDWEDNESPHGYSHQELINRIQSNEWQLRARVHGYHEFSGLGKAEEWPTDPR